MKSQPVKFDLEAIRAIEREKRAACAAESRAERAIARRPPGPFSTAAIMASIREAGR